MHVHTHTHIAMRLCSYHYYLMLNYITSTYIIVSYRAKVLVYFVNEATILQDKHICGSDGLVLSYSPPIYGNYAQKEFNDLSFCKILPEISLQNKF